MSLSVIGSSKKSPHNCLIAILTCRRKTTLMETYLPKATVAITYFLLLISSLICCAQESWVIVSNANIPEARTLHSAVWTGSRMIVWGGGSGDVPFFETGGVYNASENTWSSMSVQNAPEARSFHTAIWAETRMIVWGGHNTASPALSSGGIYTYND